MGASDKQETHREYVEAAVRMMMMMMVMTMVMAMMMMLMTMIMTKMSMITTMMIVNLRQTRNPDIQSILRPQGNRHATVCTLGQVWSPCTNNVCTFAHIIYMYSCKERLYFIYCISPVLKYKCCEESVNY